VRLRAIGRSAAACGGQFPRPALLPALDRGEGFGQRPPYHHAALRVEGKPEVLGHQRHDVHPEELELFPLEGGLEGIAEKMLRAVSSGKVPRRCEAGICRRVRKVSKERPA